MPTARLARFAIRASRDPAFLGYWLLAAQTAHGWSTDELRAHLGVDEERLAGIIRAGQAADRGEE